MAKVQHHQSQFEKAAEGLSNHDRKVLVQDYFVPLKEYIDFSFAHNGYKHVLEYFKRKEGPRDVTWKNRSTSEGLSTSESRKAAKISISGISMKNEQKNLDNNKSNLNSSLKLIQTRFYS
jgi:hypothetical protein